MVFDIGNVHVKGREWKVGKRRSRGLLLKDGIGRGGKQEGRGREEREKKGGEQRPLTIKIVPAPLASKHQFGRPVKMLQTSWPLMGFAIKQTQSSRKFQSQDQSYSAKARSQVAKESPKAFAFKTKVTFHNMPIETSV